MQNLYHAVDSFRMSQKHELNRFPCVITINNFIFFVICLGNFLSVFKKKVDGSVGDDDRKHVP